MAKWGIKNPPKKTGRYLVTIKTPFGTRQVRQADRVKAHWKTGEFAWHLLNSTGYCNDVIAWQKCPEPYYEQ